MQRRARRVLISEAVRRARIYPKDAWRFILCENVRLVLTLVSCIASCLAPKIFSTLVTRHGGEGLTFTVWKIEETKVKKRKQELWKKNQSNLKKDLLTFLCVSLASVSHSSVKKSKITDAWLLWQLAISESPGKMVFFFSCFFTSLGHSFACFFLK